MSLAAPSRCPGRPKGLDSTCRDKLLAAALSSFACHGFDGVSLRTIANAAGFNVSMVSHHFGSKVGLWQAVVDTIALDHQDMLSEFKALNELDQPLANRTMRALDLMLDRLAARPEAIMFVTREISDPSERLDYLVERLIRPSTEAYAPFWLEAMDAGLLRPIDPVTFHMGLFGCLAMVLASRPIIGQLGGREMTFEQLKAEMHIIVNLTQSD